MDTQTSSKIADPKQVYNALKGYVDKAAKFDSYSLMQKNLKRSMIANREIELAVPRATTPAQWVELKRAVEYGAMRGVKVKITEVK